MCTNADGLRTLMGCCFFLTQLGVSLILLSQLSHVILKLRLLGLEVLLELLEEQQRSEQRWSWRSGGGGVGKILTLYMSGL